MCPRVPGNTRELSAAVWMHHVPGGLLEIMSSHMSHGAIAR